MKGYQKMNTNIVDNDILAAILKVIAKDVSREYVKRMKDFDFNLRKSFFEKFKLPIGAFVDGVKITYHSRLPVQLHFGRPIFLTEACVLQRGYMVYSFRNEVFLIAARPR